MLFSFEIYTMINALSSYSTWSVTSFHRLKFSLLTDAEVVNKGTVNVQTKEDTHLTAQWVIDGLKHWEEQSLSHQNTALHQKEKREHSLEYN